MCNPRAYRTVKAGEYGDLLLCGVEPVCYDGEGINQIRQFFASIA